MQLRIITLPFSCVVGVAVNGVVGGGVMMVSGGQVEPLA